MEPTLERIRDTIVELKDQEIDIIYHPHSSYRMIKKSKARIGAIYENFFEVEINTVSYGPYKTTIRYVDVLTGSCSIILHVKQ